MGWTENETLGNVDLDRPGVGVWVSLLTRSMRLEGLDDDRQAAWAGALARFVSEFRRHPGRMLAWEVRDYLWRRGELGGVRPTHSLWVAMDCLAFFYGKVVPRPSLEAVAKQPFAGMDLAPAVWIEPWLDSLREDLACQSTSLAEFDRQRTNLRAELHELGSFPDAAFRARKVAYFRREAELDGSVSEARSRPEAPRRKRPDMARPRSILAGKAGLDFFNLFGLGKTTKPA